MDYRRYSWCDKDKVNSNARKQVTPRISLIMAIDNLGNMYAAMTQVNTDSDVMALYLVYLVKQLDIERPRWRRDTILMLDGALYH